MFSALAAFCSAFFGFAKFGEAGSGPASGTVFALAPEEMLPPSSAVAAFEGAGSGAGGVLSTSASFWSVFSGFDTVGEAPGEPASETLDFLAASAAPFG